MRIINYSLSKSNAFIIDHVQNFQGVKLDSLFYLRGTNEFGLMDVDSAKHFFTLIKDEKLQVEARKALNAIEKCLAYSSLTINDIAHPRFTYALTKMLGESGFINYSIYNVVSKKSNEKSICIHYLVKSMEHLNDYLSNTFQSSISLNKKWEGTPFNLSTTLNHNQNTNTKIVNLTLPAVTFSMNRIFPFKSKKVGKGKKKKKGFFSKVFGAK